MITTTLEPSCAPDAHPNQLYQQAIAGYGPDIARFVIGYERDSERRQELLQDVHVALWQSFSNFKAQCSLRTWVYRVAHNVGVDHIQRSRKTLARDSIDLDDTESVIDPNADIALRDRKLDLQRLLALIHRLAPLDREVVMLYLEDLDAVSIGEITGISARNVATKVHRIKSLLANQLTAGSKQA